MPDLPHTALGPGAARIRKGKAKGQKAWAAVSKQKPKPPNPASPWRRSPMVKRHANYQRMVKWGRIKPKPEKEKDDAEIP